MDYIHPTTRCEKCNRDIISTNYIVHQVRCTGLAASRISIPQSQHPSSINEVPRGSELPKGHRIENPSKFNLQTEPEAMRIASIASKRRFINEQSKIEPKVDSHSEQRRNPIFGSEMGRQAEPARMSKKREQQRFPCMNCGYNMTLTELDTHPNTCEGKQKRCEYCAVEYPASLLSDHEKLCPAKRQIEHLKRQSQVEQEQEQFHSFDSEEESQESYSRPNQYIIHQHRRRPEQGIVRQISIHQLMNNLFAGRDLTNVFRRLIQANQMPEEQGLDREHLRRLKRYKFKPTGEDVLCTICYCNLEQNEKVIELRCKHMYHDECIVKWLEQNPKCPVCKQQAQ